MDDVSDAIRMLGAPLTVTRRTAATMVNGYRVAPSTSTLTVTAVPDPLTGDELARMPDGLRARGVRALFCDQALRTVGGALEPDLVDLEGSSWEVQTSQPWSAGNFFRVVVAGLP